MIRIWLIVIVVCFIVFKIFRLKRKILLAKSFIFINEIKSNTPLPDAVYRANLLDFMTKKEAKSILHSALLEVQKNYEGKSENLISRAKSWGFINTHTNEIFAKRKRVVKNLEKLLTIQDPKIFSDNPTKTAKDIVFSLWDTHSFSIASLSDETILLKLLYERFQKTKEKYCLEIAKQYAQSITSYEKFNDDDLRVISDWKDLIKSNKK